MSGYDEQLRKLLAQCTRKQKLKAMAEELHAQRDTYTAQVQALKQKFQEEQEDVERLEGRSLSSFFYNVIGKMDEKLTQEKQEAYAARAKYDTAARELEGIQEDLRRCEAELDSLRDCETRYATVLQEKTQAVKAAGGSTAEQILALEGRACFLTSQERELEEACAAGSAALATTEKIADSLHNAKNWGTWDLVGGGMFADLAKHSHLDEAQAYVELLQSQLRRFKTELADVTIDANFQVNVDGFLRVADYLFDGIFADWTVLDKIQKSQRQIQNTRAQICQVLDDLQALMDQTAKEAADIQQNIKQLVERVPM